MKDVPGFIVNRVMRPYYVTAQRLVNTQTSCDAVDEGARSIGGVPMGPFELMDLIGLDTNLAITTALYEALGRPERFVPPPIQKTLVGGGMTGKKCGIGFYTYNDGKKTGVNPAVTALLKPGTTLGGNDVWNSLRVEIVKEAEMVVLENTAGQTDIDTAIKLAMNFPKGPFEWRKESTAA